MRMVSTTSMDELELMQDYIDAMKAQKVTMDTLINAQDDLVKDRARTAEAKKTLEDYQKTHTL